MNADSKLKFTLGKIVTTPGAFEAVGFSTEEALRLLARHASGDWGDDLCEEDKKLNDQAIANEGDPEKQMRVLSSYITRQAEKLWIITEWDRSVTTLLTPDEY